MNSESEHLAKNLVEPPELKQVQPRLARRMLGPLDAENGMVLFS